MGIDEMRNLIRRVAVLFVILVSSYLFVWALVYSVVMEFDYSYLGGYFVLAWRRGGELPATIQMLTFVFMALSALVAFGFWLYRSRAKPKGAKSQRSPGKRNAPGVT